MNIIIQHCNSIESSILNLEKGIINIKYGINGTGKSSIAKGIHLSCNDKKNGTSSLIDLKPFKFKNNIEVVPQISGIEEITSVSVFNEEYIGQYVFQKDEVIKDSFQVFIKDSTYELGIIEIESLIEDIKKSFNESKEIDELIQDLTELQNSFGKSKGISKASTIYKGFEIGNKLEDIPEPVKAYSDYIKNDANIKWMNWQFQGGDFLDISTCCPYCTSEIDQKKETILAVKDVYNPKTIEHLNKVIDVVGRLKQYFSDDTYKMIIDLSKSVNGIKKEQEVFLLTVREQISVLIERLQKIKYLSFGTLRDIQKVSEVLNDYIIQIEYLPHMKSSTTIVKISKINESLNMVIDKAGILQGKVNKQKKHIEETIKLYKTEVNSFLSSAGYKYNIEIVKDGIESYKMVLRHNDFDSAHIDKPNLHLSFGERNAFALVLFMFETIRKNPDLVILDDPISSFDNNKKFAILNMLFRGEKSLRGMTVLMLTHDFAPVVDMVHHLPHIFDRVPSAYFLENLNGHLIEKMISKNDIKTFVEVAKDNIANLEETLNKLIFLRRLYEINDDKGGAFQLLSNLFHKREVPLLITNGINREMTQEEIHNATNVIIEHITGFDYKKCLEIILDSASIKELYNKAQSNYEKLQLFRILNDDNIENIVISKFVKETFHIENDYLYQLNPCNYMTVPSFIIEECDKAIVS